MKELKDRADILVGNIQKPCLICGKPTYYVEICSEGRFCSPECLDRFYDEWATKNEWMMYNYLEDYDGKQ